MLIELYANLVIFSLIFSLLITKIKFPKNANYLIFIFTALAYSSLVRDLESGDLPTYRLLLEKYDFLVVYDALSKIFESSDPSIFYDFIQWYFIILREPVFWLFASISYWLLNDYFLFFVAYDFLSFSVLYLGISLLINSDYFEHRIEFILPLSLFVVSLAPFVILYVSTLKQSLAICFVFLMCGCLAQKKLVIAGTIAVICVLIHNPSIFTLAFLLLIFEIKIRKILIVFLCLALIFSSLLLMFRFGDIFYIFLDNRSTPIDKGRLVVIRDISVFVLATLITYVVKFKISPPGIDRICNLNVFATATLFFVVFFFSSIDLDRYFNYLLMIFLPVWFKVFNQWAKFKPEANIGLMIGVLGFSNLVMRVT